MKSFKFEKSDLGGKSILEWILTIVVVLVVGTGASLFIQSLSEPTDDTIQPNQSLIEPEELEISARTIVLFTNQEREKAGLKPLDWDMTLDETAQFKAELNTLEHVYEGVRGVEYIFEAAPECVYGGENIAGLSLDSKMTVDSWMNSPTHRDNILDPDYEYIGVGIDNGYAVQHFCAID